MAGVNKVILVGNLGNDPQIKTFENGDKIANLSIATSEKYTDRSGQKVETTEWHNLVMNKHNAENAEKYLHKGDTIYVEGKLRTRSWEKDGHKFYTTEVLVQSMTFIKTAGSSTGTSNSTQDRAPLPSSAQDLNLDQQSEDDLPF